MQLDNLIELKNSFFKPVFSRLENFVSVGVLLRGKEQGIYVVMKRDDDISRKVIQNAMLPYPELHCAYLFVDSIVRYPYND